MMSKILPCTCKSEFQDKEYGKNQRLHYRPKKNKQEHDRQWRCTSCGNVKG